MEAAEADIGRLVAGRYRLLERIGRGGMGTVWRAEDELLGRPVAVKRVHAPVHLSDDEIATLHERTRREARSAARITHPDVVTIHDVVEDAGAPCIVMEYVPSSTLADLLKQHGTISPGEAARIGLHIIAALRAAHAAGVLHRDVKPANVLLAANGRVVLTDFGVARSVGTSTLTKTGEFVGSIDYLPPERVRGGGPSPASDLWALGATLYQAVEGQPPFRKDQPIETAYAIAVDPLEPPRQAGPLTELIEMLLVKEPESRPSAEFVERSLRELATDVSTPPRQGRCRIRGQHRHRSRGPRRHRRPWWLPAASRRGLGHRSRCRHGSREPVQGGAVAAEAAWSCWAWWLWVSRGLARSSSSSSAVVGPAMTLPSAKTPHPHSRRRPEQGTRRLRLPCPRATTWSKKTDWVVSPSRCPTAGSAR